MSHWVFNQETEKLEWREISYVPGLYKIFGKCTLAHIDINLDEILVNAADNFQRDNSMTSIKIDIDAKSNMISIWNNGAGIPVAMHEKENCMVPEMIFGQLLTSSNYNDDEKKTTGGRNGYGAKLANIFSTKFVLETCDTKRNKTFKMTWKHNMSEKSQAEMGKSMGMDFTKITFYPDL